MKRDFAKSGPKKWSIFSSMVLKLIKARNAAIPALVILIAGSVSAEVSLSFVDALRLSEAHSYAIQAACSDSLSGIYDLGAARALRYPTASLAATYFYLNTVQSQTLPFPGVPASLTIGVHNNYQADLRLSLPLWTGGRISNQIDLQKAILGSRSANLEAARLNNAYGTRKAYLGLLTSQAVAKSAEASLSRIKLINDDTQHLYDNGQADSVDLLNSDLALQRALQTHDERSTAVVNSRALLARLVGLPADTIAIADTLPDPDIQIYLNQRPVRDSIDRAELRAQDSRIKAANFTVSLNRSNYLPTLSSFGGYSVGKPNKNVLGNKWNDYWTTGLNLNWDFNLGNRTGKIISSARQAANSARATKDDLEDALYLQASTAYDNLLLSYRSYDIARKEFEISQRQYALGQQKQKAGGLSLYRLLELEADLTSSEQLFRASIMNYYLSETEYLYAIGSPKIFGGFAK